MEEVKRKFSGDEGMKNLERKNHTVTVCVERQEGKYSGDERGMVLN